ncbi:hypothetical protein [Segetibacter aerophilus]|uniref:hypothetical protein n=1 Tax=Segetibacter aerophilus TaxID=670293 RepID=UPI0011BDC08C|nr:hypothetical protein [Segetibacter aerophilus]
MRKALAILQKVLVNYFFRVNAGLFMFAFFVLFGLPYSVLAFHYSLITGVVQSQTFLALVMVVWLLYNIKCVDYISKQLKHQHQSFLFCLNCLPDKKNYLLQLYVQVQVYMPVLLYSIAIVAIALKQHHYLAAIEVILFNLMVLVLTPFLYLKVLQRKPLNYKGLAIPSLGLELRKPYFLYPLYFLLKDRKQMLLITKIFSLLLLYGFIQLYQPERADIRPVQLCLLITAAAHCAIVFEVRMFEDEYLQFSKNLPITLIGRFFKSIALYLILLLPEMVFLLKGIHTQFSIYNYPQLVLMLIALICMFHVVLLLEKTNMEQFIRIVFAISAACFFVILYDPGVLLAAMILALAFVLYSSYFYQYEKQ